MDQNRVDNILQRIIKLENQMLELQIKYKNMIEVIHNLEEQLSEPFTFIN